MTYLIAYFPEIKPLIGHGRGIYDLLSNGQRHDLIAAAIIREIKRKGEWEAFLRFAAEEFGEECAEKVLKITDDEIVFGLLAWLTDPSTLIKVAGEWVKTKEGL